MTKRPRKLSNAQIRSALKALEGWSLERGKLHREYRFRDFVDAFDFMTCAALLAEMVDHHPEWFNVYGTVKIDLMTHDVGGISTRDVDMARRLEQLARTRGAVTRAAQSARRQKLRAWQRTRPLKRSQGAPVAG